MKKVIAFADEFGNNSFEFNTQGSHFIIASVIMNQDELDEIQIQLEEIRKKFFQTGEIKSSKVKNNHNRRILILRELKKVNFSVYAVVIDKRKLYGEGFKYKQSFYKYLNGILYKELYRTFPQLELKVDEHGGNDFMRSFKKYVEKNHIRNLFAGSDFHIQKSHNDLGVQLADFMAGTLGYIFDELKKSYKSSEFADLINEKLISLNQFPKAYKIEKFNEKDTFNEYDETIATLSLNRVFDFIDKATGNTQDNRDRINFLKLLLLYHQSNHPRKYTTSNEFVKHLSVNRQKQLSKEQFSSKVIGYLRDKGVLIASSRDGYKIPTSATDMKKFINHGNSIILPVLRRIEECRSAILLATTNEYDILDDPAYGQLRELIENVR
ncbi:DUF3800 domain-containing protein [Salegentibacter sp. LM13S]|uniref:DUF3800 domain-containing protein n=1 Tax=Salegentibacter lacus TaxID=2873599 RepID=UPI001CCBBDA1|nr:DUF3800 domain-containing protein [Salegentibacter lacus]MBZ9631906.1 DUF3800 domain-containing protein [Salegentibacter lacus]